MQSLRSTPLIFVPDTGKHLSLTYDLTTVPEETDAGLRASASGSGKVQTQPAPRTQDRLRLQQEDIPDSEAAEWEDLYRRVLSRGLGIYVLRDRSRGLSWLGSDPDGRDERMRLSPRSGSTFTRVLRGNATTGADCFGVFSADPSGRTNRVLNGDFGDAIGSEWTISDPARLSMVREAAWVQPAPDVAAGWFFAKATGTKKATLAITLSANVTGLSDITVSWLQRARRYGSVVGLSVMTVKLYNTANAAETSTLYTGTPTSEWTRKVKTVDVSGWSTSSTSVSLELTFTDDLQNDPIQITHIQAEERAFSTGFLPYSTTRGETGSRLAEACRWTHVLSAIVQESGERLAYTFACYLTVPWAPADLSGNITLLDHSDGPAGYSLGSNFRIWADSAGLYLDYKSSSGVEVTSTLSTTAWVALSALDTVHLVVSWLDATQAGSNGYLSFSIDGVQSLIINGHSRWLGSLGRFLWLGCKADGTEQMNAWLSGVFIDPVYVPVASEAPTVTTATVAEYTAPAAPSARNGWYAKLDPRQKGSPVRLRPDNTYQLDLSLIEHTL